MNKRFFILICLINIFCSCIKDEALNPEADILTLSFPAGTLRAKVVINNDNIVVFPKKNIDLVEQPISNIEISPGGSFKRIDNPLQNDTLFFIEVISESKEYSKIYPIIQVLDIPDKYSFENWITPSKNYKYENPIEGSLLWYSSNNGTAIAWNSPSKAADAYPVRQIEINGNKGVELRTMAGPGDIIGGTKIPCLAGSLYLGGFNPLTGLSDPLRSTHFGVPFNSGKPIKLTGYYRYEEGKEDYINPDGSKDKDKQDICSIYSVLYKADGENEFLYGDNVATSPNIIARAEVKAIDVVRGSEDMIYFDVEFDYQSYLTPFRWEELENNEYKISIVFSSSHRGQHYEGRPGSTLAIDEVQLIYESN